MSLFYTFTVPLMRPNVVNEFPQHWYDKLSLHICVPGLKHCVSVNEVQVLSRARIPACTHACALAHLGCPFIRGIMVKWNAEILAASNR